MLTDIADVPQGAVLEADVCIAGAGAAGITLARALMNKGYVITLVESGGLDHDPVTQALGTGNNIGMDYYDLQETRLRFFGGTTNIWGGRCTPLNAIDFMKRSWVPHSGWPIAKNDLSAGYAKAQQDLEIGPCCYDESLWRTFGAAPPAFDGETFTTSFWRFDEVRERFNAKRCKDLFAAKDVRIITRANVVHLQATPNADKLAHITVGALDGKCATIMAKYYVLACGGIENARLLLASRDVEKQGVGNRHDQVGRYFMEHAHGRLGRVISHQVYQIWNAFRMRAPRNSVPLAPVLRPAAALQEQAEILNTALTFKWQRNPLLGVPAGKRLYRSLKHQLEPNKANRRLWRAFRRLQTWYQRNLRATAMRGFVKLPNRQLSVMIRAEQAPNPASRVTLSATKDTLGSPKADLDWRLSNQDRATLRQLAQSLDAELVRLDFGRFEPSSWIDETTDSWPVDPTVGNHPIGGYHHMGTTRMSTDSAHGVVDADCRVHGYRNLYIAGSSVFPTGGWANPTLTILALAYRLQDHLQARLKSAQ